MVAPVAFQGDGDDRATQVADALAVLAGRVDHRRHQQGGHDIILDLRLFNLPFEHLHGWFLAFDGEFGRLDVLGQEAQEAAVRAPGQRRRRPVGQPLQDGLTLGGRAVDLHDADLAALSRGPVNAGRDRR